MIKNPHLTLFDLVVCLSDAMDLVSPSLVSHHKQVAYLASSIAEELKLGAEKQKDLILAGALHDIGALSLQERLDTLSFETTETSRHADLGNALLAMFEPLSNLAPIVKHHHATWTNKTQIEDGSEHILLESHILHLADRVAVLIDKKESILLQVPAIIEKICNPNNTIFHPDVIEAFRAVAQKESFWLDTVSPGIFRILRQKARHNTIVLDLHQLDNLALFFSKIIDFRSRFTAAHSAGVAASAHALARLAGFSKRECDMMRIAGFLHDLGKLAVPKHILEKPASLTKEEFAIIRTHTYHTYRILDTLEDFDTINTWGSFHHERLNGAGYPFHHKEDVLSLGSRIMCVADIFTAITEDRPYRAGMGNSEALKVISAMVRGQALDGAIVSLLETNLAEINNIRSVAQKESVQIYSDLFLEIDNNQSTKPI